MAGQLLRRHGGILERRFIDDEARVQIPGKVPCKETRLVREPAKEVAWGLGARSRSQGEGVVAAEVGFVLPNSERLCAQSLAPNKFPDAGRAS